MGNFVDVRKLVYSTLKEAISPVPLYGDVPSDKTNALPWVQYTITSPQKVSNAAYRRGVSFTLALNVMHRDKPGVEELADTVLAAALDLPKRASDLGRISRMEVEMGPEEANTPISSTNHRQLSMTLTGIARKE